MWKTFFAFILIAFLGLAAYSNSFGVPFQLDDYSSVVDNPVIRNLGDFTSSLEGYHYNPRRFVGYATFALNYHFNRLNTTGYHAVNIAIHIINAFLVYVLILLTLRTPYFDDRRAEKSSHPPAQIIALFSALLFLAHPLQTESVTYIVQRFASLAAMFYLLSLVLFIRGRLIQVSAKTETGDAYGQRKTLILTVACYILAFLCAVLAVGTKETAYTLPFMIVAFEFLFFSSGFRRRLLFLSLIATTVAVAGFFIFLKYGMSFREIISRLEALTMVQSYGSRSVYFMTELRVIISYIRLLLFPINQSISYDYPIYRSFFTPEVFLSALLLSALFFVAIYLIFRSRAAATGSRIAPAYRLAAFGILWFFIALSVESSFIPISDVIFEHRTYLPSVGILISVVTVIFTLTRTNKARKAAVIVVAVIVTLLSAATYARNDVWSSPVSLWKDAISKAPHLSRPYFILGAEYARRGSYEQAIGMYRRALAMPPREYLSLRASEYPKMYNALGLLYAQIGRYDKAIEVFRKLLWRYPDFAGTYNNLGAAYVNSGRYREAVGPLLQAIERRPDNVDARYNLALAYYWSGDRNEAMQQAAILKRISPKLASELISQMK